MKQLIIFLLLVVTGSFSLTSCSDWNDDESVDIVNPTHPEYAKYLQKLKAYKEGDHKFVYGEFDNSIKATSSRGQHLGDVPDSVDVVILKHPAALADFEIKEMKKLQDVKGTKIVYAVNYDKIEKAYLEMVKLETEKDPNYKAPDFIAYMQKEVKELLELSSTYQYNGIVIGYRGMGYAHMTQAEKEVYNKKQIAFFAEINEWAEANKDKMLVYYGLPQYLMDAHKALLASCKHIILMTNDVKDASELSLRVLEAKADKVPTDKFIVTVNTTSLDSADKSTGYYGPKRALAEAAYWTTKGESGFVKAGLAILDLQNDYYNSEKTYRYSREAINIMDPAPKN